MESRVLRPTPGPWRLGLNFLVGTFAVALLTMCAYGSDEPPSDTSVVIIGLSLFAFLAILTALAVRNYFAATLRLSSEPGLEIGKHKVAWTDVAAFQRGSRFIRVFYAPGREPGRSATVTETLGNIGLYFPPTYLVRQVRHAGPGSGSVRNPAARTRAPPRRGRPPGMTLRRLSPARHIRMRR